MVSLADSSAFFDTDRLLAQHQAALTVLQGMLSNPTCQELAWLDLACGKGQIIAHLMDILSETERKKLKFVGFDIENTFTRHAKRIAESVGLGSVNFHIGELSLFWQHNATTGPWRFITLTNTIHEISPEVLAEIVVRCIERLHEQGCLFIYDMDRLPEAELGAVPWSAPEMKSILWTLFKSLGCERYEPSVGKWQHRECNGWNAQLLRANMDLPADYRDRIPNAVATTAAIIRDLLAGRLVRVNAALESLAENGSASGEEDDEKLNLLYEFWAVSRALGRNVLK